MLRSTEVNLEFFWFVHSVLLASLNTGHLSFATFLPSLADLTDDARWYGTTFPMALSNDGTNTNLPDAYPCHEGLLPHQHDDIESHFPAAVACDALDDSDPPEDDSLEKIGKQLGFEGNEAVKGSCHSYGDNRGEDSPGNHHGALALSSTARCLHSSPKATRAGQRQHGHPVGPGFVRLKIVLEEESDDE